MLEKMELPMELRLPEESPFCNVDDITWKVRQLNNTPGQQHDGYDCPKCQNKEVIYFSADGRIVAKDCTCKVTRKCIRAMERSGLKNVMKKFRFDNFITETEWQQKMKSIAQSYASNPIRWFLIAGQSGCGKTHIASAVCRQLLLDGHEVYYSSWRDIVPKIKANALNAERREELMKPLKASEYLYIDDLLKAGQTDADVAIAFEILNTRIINDLPTIITTELSYEELYAVDMAITGRMIDNAGDNCLFIKKDNSKNYRLRKVTFA